MENYVLPPTDPGVPEISNLTWDAQAAYNAVNDDVTKLGFGSLILPAGYPANNYVCNNVGFVVTVAAQNQNVRLAGGLIELHPSLAIAPKVGFLHYPQSITTDQESLLAWAAIVKKIVSVETK